MYVFPPYLEKGKQEGEKGRQYEVLRALGDHVGHKLSHGEWGWVEPKHCDTSFSGNNYHEDGPIELEKSHKSHVLMPTHKN